MAGGWQHDRGQTVMLGKEAFDVTAPSVSYHLKILREAGLISSERRGTWVYYRVNPGVMARMSAVLAPPAAAAAGRDEIAGD
jgi:ArsR family transcriptional regulator